jgi:hypothetical protein
MVYLSLLYEILDAESEPAMKNDTKWLTQWLKQNPRRELPEDSFGQKYASDYRPKKSSKATACEMEWVFNADLASFEQDFVDFGSDI